jgi:hypothetical protein
MKQTTIHNVGNPIPGLGQAIKYGMKCGLNIPDRDRNLSLFSILISSNNILCNKANIDLYYIVKQSPYMKLSFTVSSLKRK